MEKIDQRFVLASFAKNSVFAFNDVLEFALSIIYVPKLIFVIIHMRGKASTDFSIINDSYESDRK
ncbi:hypothetical protein ACTXT7_011441 [Hymenolepis weldensis]